MIQTYKFRSLIGPNVCVLPVCESLTLHRAEGTAELDILYAPRLRELNVQAAYELEACARSCSHNLLQLLSLCQRIGSKSRACRRHTSLRTAPLLCALCIYFACAAAVGRSD